ncbi:MAG: PAS domain-containing sensor histidine kinase [Candidatus Saccharimonadales bacterium]
MIFIIIVGGLILAVGIFFGVPMHKSGNQSGGGGGGMDHKLNADVLLQSVADGVVVIDISGKITLVNPSAADLLGWPANEAVGLNVNSVVKLTQENGKDIDEASNPFTSVLRDKQAFKNTLQLVAKNGTNRVVSIVVSPLVLPPDYQLVGAVAVLRDISRQHQEEAQRAEFISTASHEMRTPVAAIEGYLALAMNDRVSKIDSKAREYLEKAHSSTQHLGKLFQDLLTSAKAEDGRLSSHPSVVEVGSFLEQLTQDLKFSAEKKGLAMELVMGSGGEVTDARDSNSRVVRPLYYVYVDADRVHEVITNLADNAIKYSDSGRITIGLTGDNEVVQIFVRDTGAGIPPEDVPHLFQKFYRVNNTLTRTVGGTGLGLFISKKIVELYGGRIWVESEVGKGSTFYINLPRLSSEKAAQLKQTETGLPNDGTIRPTTV